MKTKILAATLIMALGVSAWADTSANEDDTSSTTTQEGAAADKPTPAATTNEGPRRAERQAPIEKREFIDNEGNKKDLTIIDRGSEGVQAFVCSPGHGDNDCFSTKLVDIKSADDISAIEAALRKSLAEKKVESKSDARKSAREERREARERSRAEDSTAKEFREEFREELSDTLSTECNIDYEAEKPKRRYEVSAQDTLSKALAGTRFAGMELPKQNNKADCAGKALSEFMDDKEDALSELEIDQESVAEMRTEIRELKKDIRDEKDPKAKEVLQQELSAKEAELKALRKEADLNRKKLQIADNELKSFVDSYLIKSAIQDVAASPQVGLTYLHDLASGTPEVFGGVRKSAADALLQVYKLQAQSQLALQDAAARTNDPALKGQFSEAALVFAQNGLNFNTTMMNQGTRQEMYQNARQRYLNSAAMNPKAPTLDEERDAQAYANGVVSDIYSSYSPGAQQISSYLTGLSTNTNVNGVRGQVQPGQVNTTGLPTILADGTIAGTTTGLPVTGNGGMRAARQQQGVSSMGQMNAGPGRTGQPMITRGQRPTVLPNH